MSAARPLSSVECLTEEMRDVKPVADQRPQIWDEEADVIVVGYGFAGATAAITAHDLGAKVVLLEKAPEAHKGGNSRVSANIVFWPDNIAKAKVYFKALAGPYLDNISDAMVEVWATEMHANREWLVGLGFSPVALPRAMSVEFPELAGSDCSQMLLHGEGPMGDERLWKGVTEPAMQARNIRTLYSTAAVSLVKQHGEIVGVIANAHGKRLTIEASRAVILTCGGFENNPSMGRTYLEGLPHIFPVGTPYNTGDGIRMGIGVGADLWHMNNISGPVFFFKAPEIPVSSWTNIPHAKSYLFIAGDGTRFTAEGQPVSVSDRHGKVKRHGIWAQQPAPIPIYFVFDESVRKAGPIGRAHADWDLSHGNRYDWSEDNLREIDRGWIKKASTVQELAALIGIAPDAMESSVLRFNRFATEGCDGDYGRRPESLAALQSPPYYAMELTPTFINTQGGPRRDRNAQVIGTDGAPIPRLYSAGELGSIYSFLYQGGGNIGECFAFGRIAGRNAAQATPRLGPALAHVNPGEA